MTQKLHDMDDDRVQAYLERLAADTSLPENWPTAGQLRWRAEILQRLEADDEPETRLQGAVATGLGVALFVLLAAMAWTLAIVLDPDRAVSGLVDLIAMALGTAILPGCLVAALYPWRRRT